MYIFRRFSSVGSSLGTPPKQKIDSDCACVCVAYVSACADLCVRSSVRGAIPPWLGLGVCKMSGVRPSARSVRRQLPLFTCFPLLPVPARCIPWLPVASR